MSDPMVTVIGPHNRHIEVHASTQKALPDAFPLAPTKTPAPKKPPRKTAAKRTSTKRDEPPTTGPVIEAPSTPDSPATADENTTVETPKEAR
ncbi:hypothetical protein J2X60_003016 [Curtobacterium sp. 320]|uniref:hypothetical protein n=1 Tax=Curtobacterium sp. 320 TaxID=2817749 RepID=UPI002856AB9B|nr:hypothetical protein [Curtobacterium sp. 320]MDR6574357.1 hypothetical protein [Curtobacterium sp. 320]